MTLYGQYDDFKFKFALRFTLYLWYLPRPSIVSPNLPTYDQFNHRRLNRLLCVCVWVWVCALKGWRNNNDKKISPIVVVLVTSQMGPYQISADLFRKSINPSWPFETVAATAAATTEDLATFDNTTFLFLFTYLFFERRRGTTDKGAD